MSRGTNISKCLNCGEEFLCGDCIDTYCPKCKEGEIIITPTITRILHIKDQEIATLKTEIQDEVRRHTETGRLYNELFVKYDKLVKEHEETKILLAGYFKTLNRANQELEHKRDIIDKFINAVDRGDFELEIGIHYNQFKKDMGYDKT